MFNGLVGEVARGEGCAGGHGGTIGAPWGPNGPPWGRIGQAPLTSQCLAKTDYAKPVIQYSGAAWSSQKFVA